MGVRLWQKAGYRFGIITHRSSQIVKTRMAELGIEIIRQGIDDKLAAMRKIVEQARLEPAQICYIGDDLPDLSAVRAAGLGVAVADALRGTPSRGPITSPRSAAARARSAK